MKTVRATMNRVIVDPVKPGENETESGLVLPDSAQQHEHLGVVISVGKDVNDPLIREGAKVVYNPRSGAEIRVNKRIYLVMRDIDILSVVEGAELDIEAVK